MSVPSLVLGFRVGGEPRPKERPRFVKKGPRVITYTPAATRKAEKDIADAFRLAAPEYTPEPGALYEVSMYFAYWSARKHDIDNMQKLVLDALNGAAWIDDDQVCRTTAEKRRVPRDQAHTQITIHRIIREELPDGRAA